MKKMTMKMTKLFTLAALALMGMTMTSCGDDEETVDPVVDRMTLLTNNSSKEWQFTAQMEDEENITSNCQLDDVWTFKSEGIVELVLNEECYEGQNDDENQIGWKFNDDETFLMSLTGEEGFKILELTSTKLILELEYENEGRSFRTQLVFIAK